MNVRLLRKVKKHILEEPKRFVMSEGLVLGEAGETVNVGQGEYEPADAVIPACGTVACIAGWTCVLGVKDWRQTSWPNIQAKAIELLGIRSRPENLFRVDYWPAKFRNRYYNAKTQKTRAKIAAACIEHFISTKGAE